MEPFVGQIQTFGFNFAPRNWATCDGQILSIAQNTALFSLLGTIYGGNGQSTFALPDLRGRTMVHPGQGPGLSIIDQGEMDGVLSQTLNIGNLPAHTHSVAIAVNIKVGEEADPINKIASSPDQFNTVTTPNGVLGGLNQVPVGQNIPFSIANPYLGINCSIALTGIFPARN